jgi:hypothetical protein
MFSGSFGTPAAARWIEDSGSPDRIEDDHEYIGFPAFFGFPGRKTCSLQLATCNSSKVR